MFTRRDKPNTGTFGLNNDTAAAQDQRIEVVLGGRTDHQSIVWHSVYGELRIENDQDSGT
jgi:hypothetical protein